ncbi:MAG: hypothetical protein BBJ60_12485 [Desulfobacterales bacterium S7086C20]|nr:MAG: hypothetical protein BBJ60_12485 [Desulfobacterales bacterium S7086C20]
MGKKRIDNPRRPVFPTPAALITCVDREGKPNIITLGEVAIVSIRPARISIGLRPVTYSNGLIKATREYVVNFPTADMVEKVDMCGTRSGRDSDKFDVTGLTPEPAIHVKPPLIEECPINLECKVLGIFSFGSHDLFIGDIVMMHVEEDILLDDKIGQVDPSKGLIFAMNAYWRFGERINTIRFTGKKGSAPPV